MRTKLIDTPQTKKAITLLAKMDALNAELLKIETENKKIQNKLIAQHEKQQLAFYKKISKVKDALQEVCSHNKLEIIDDFDYHRREEWTITNCAICKKRISRV